MCCPQIWKTISLLLALCAVTFAFQQYSNATASSLILGTVSEPALAAQETAAPSESAASATSQDLKSDETDAVHRQQLIEDLEEYLTGTKWTGTFTVRGKDKLTKEEYEIISAKKDEEDDWWVLLARIKYNDHDVKVPIGIEIKWAGDTPVITAKDLTIPLMGTFNARVLIDEGQYAGTWSHGKVGGHMYGTIEKMEVESKEAPAEKEPATESTEADSSDGNQPAAKNEFDK
jgi:hypothetical protein